MAAENAAKPAHPAAAAFIPAGVCVCVCVRHKTLGHSKHTLSLHNLIPRGGKGIWNKAR